MNADDRRQFWRATFKSPAHLIDSHGPTRVQVEDLSLKGALVEADENWAGTQGEHCRLCITLAPEIEINMWGTVAHIDNHHVGLCWDEIDLDSITHLRRLMELNAGEVGLLERELSTLIHKV